MMCKSTNPIHLTNWCCLNKRWDTSVSNRVFDCRIRRRNFPPKTYQAVPPYTDKTNDIYDGSFDTTKQQLQKDIDPADITRAAKLAKVQSQENSFKAVVLEWFEKGKSHGPFTISTAWGEPYWMKNWATVSTGSIIASLLCDSNQWWELSTEGKKENRYCTDP